MLRAGIALDVSPPTPAAVGGSGAVLDAVERVVGGYLAQVDRLVAAVVYAADAQEALVRSWDLVDSPVGRWTINLAFRAARRGSS